MTETILRYCRTKVEAQCTDEHTWMGAGSVGVIVGATDRTYVVEFHDILLAEYLHDDVEIVERVTPEGLEH